MPLAESAPTAHMPDTGASYVIGGTFSAKNIVGWEKQRAEFPDVTQWEALLPADLQEELAAHLVPDHILYPELGEKLGRWARYHGSLFKYLMPYPIHHQFS